MKRTLPMIAPLLSATLLLASCGGGAGTPPAPTPTPTPSPAPTPTPTPTPPAPTPPAPTPPTPTPPAPTPPADTTAPVVSLKLSHTSVTAGEPLTITADATDDVGVTRVEFRVNGELVATQNQAPYVLTYVPQNASGQALTLTVEVKAMDAAGWIRTVATSVTVNPPARTLPTYIPAAGASVGTGDGTFAGTVYVSPTAAEVELMHLINEVRTKGSIGGVDATAGTCVEGQFTPLAPMTYNGLLAYAGRKHAEYLGEVGYEGHVQTATQHAAFYGATVKDRVMRAYQELAGRDAGYASGTNNVRYGGENAAAGGDAMREPQHVLRGWLRSPGHCAALMHPEVRMMGVGRSYNADRPDAEQVGNVTRFKTNWALLVRVSPS